MAARSHRLGLVEGDIAVADELVEGRSVVDDAANTRRDHHRSGVGAHRNGYPHGFDQAFGDVVGRRSPVSLADEHHEPVTAAGDAMSRLRSHFFQPVGDDTQHGVANRASETVVQDVEVVQINHEQGTRRLPAPGQLQRLGEQCHR